MTNDLGLTASRQRGGSYSDCRLTMIPSLIMKHHGETERRSIVGFGAGRAWRGNSGLSAP
jgi:hypothetical protein